MGRLWLPLSANTPSGLAALSCPPCLPSSRCGSPSRSTTNLVPRMGTASASKHLVTFWLVATAHGFQLICFLLMQHGVAHDSSTPRKKRDWNRAVSSIQFLRCDLISFGIVIVIYV